MNILIIGASGFIGQHLLEELKGKDHHMRIVQRKNDDVFWADRSEVETVIADISDKENLENAFQNTDLVINLAAEKSDPNNLGNTNVKGVENIIALAEKYKIKKIIHLSSISVFGTTYSRKKIIVNDDHQCDPKTGYGITKLRSEQLLNEFSKKNITEVIIIRSSAVFGEHQPSRYLEDLFKRVKTQVAIPRTKESTINCVYVKDVAHAINYFILNKTGSKTITVGGTLPYQQFIDIVSKELNVTCKIKHVSSFTVALFELFFFFGSKKLRSKFRTISNCVSFDDTYMKNVITYKYGMELGVRNTIKAYNL